MTICLESLKVRFVNLTFSMDSAICVRRFCCMIISLISESFMYFGTWVRSNVGSFILGRSKDMMSTFLSSFSSILRSLVFSHSTNKALLFKSLILLTPTWGDLGSIFSFNIFLICAGVKFGCTGLMIRLAALGRLLLFPLGAGSG